MPGPTDGSWSTSPTRTSPEQLGTALKSECTSGTSTMEVSSTTRRPQASGLDSFRVKRPVPGSISSRRWIVFRVQIGGQAGARPPGSYLSRHNSKCNAGLPYPETMALPAQISAGSNLTLGYNNSCDMTEIAKAASIMGRKSAQARIEKWGKKEFVQRMREWGKLGGRPKGSGKKKPERGGK